MKIYHSIDELVDDMPKLKNQTIIVDDDFDNSMAYLTTATYKSIIELARIYNIRVITKKVYLRNYIEKNKTR
ncbi:MAG TPA: hypothetical protein PK924_07395 [Bacilli bacterium]|nr:hypothetical protein [Bacilli bacterium]HQD93072.1 hypothetical protein [Bacilli bacterium]